MTRKDTGWRPDGAMETYKGMEVWEYDVGPHERNVSVVDGDVSLEEVTATDADSVVEDD